MRIFSQLHVATNAGDDSAAVIGKNVGNSVRTHTAEYRCASGTGNATVTHYGRNGYSGDTTGGGWFPIWTYTFTGASNGDKASNTLQHAWEDYKTECSVLTGTGGKVLSTMSGA